MNKEDIPFLFVEIASYSSELFFTVELSPLLTCIATSDPYRNKQLPSGIDVEEASVVTSLFASRVNQCGISKQSKLFTMIVPVQAERAPSADDEVGLQKSLV